MYSHWPLPRYKPYTTAHRLLRSRQSRRDSLLNLARQISVFRYQIVVWSKTATGSVTHVKDHVQCKCFYRQGQDPRDYSSTVDVLGSFLASFNFDCGGIGFISFRLYRQGLAPNGYIRKLKLSVGDGNWWFSGKRNDDTSRNQLFRCIIIDFSDSCPFWRRIRRGRRPLSRWQATWWRFFRSDNLLLSLWLYLNSGLRAKTANQLFSCVIINLSR